MRGVAAGLALAAIIAVAACEIPDAPTGEECQFRGVDVVCTQHWDGKPDTTTVESPTLSDVSGDPVLSYENITQNWYERHPHIAWPPKPEPGREQDFTPYEESLSNDYRPLSPTRHCADGSMWEPSKVAHCPDGNPGTVTWVHHDGTVVTIGPNSPTGRRWNGGEIW